MVIENANATNRGAIIQNVGAPEDDIDDRKKSDHEKELMVNTTRRSRRYTADSDEEGEA